MAVYCRGGGCGTSAEVLVETGLSFVAAVPAVEGANVAVRFVIQECIYQEKGIENEVQGYSDIE